MFRGERPAAGRKRQFHQVGTECVGKIAPEIDVETIRLLEKLTCLRCPGDESVEIDFMRGINRSGHPLPLMKKAPSISCHPA